MFRKVFFEKVMFELRPKVVLEMVVGRDRSNTQKMLNLDVRHRSGGVETGDGGTSVELRGRRWRYECGSCQQLLGFIRFSLSGLTVCQARC